MKQYGYNRFECCGKKLPTRFKHCPECGESVPRPEENQATNILMQLDTRARLFEGNAQRNIERSHEAEAREIESECFNDERCYKWPTECPKCEARDEKKTRLKTAASYTKQALWNRSVERLIRDLLSNVSRQGHSAGKHDATAGHKLASAVLESSKTPMKPWRIDSANTESSHSEEAR